MGHHAQDDDLIVMQYGGRWATRCKKHILLMLHRAEHRNDAIKFAPGTIELMIVRDQFDDMLRRKVIRIAEVRAPGADWHQCPHCRMEAARKYGHLLRSDDPR